VAVAGGGPCLVRTVVLKTGHVVKVAVLTTQPSSLPRSLETLFKKSTILSY
jgi:chorismate-pyruvate lyase